MGTGERDTAAASATKRVLIVDDDPDVHQFLAIALKDTGYFLDSAFDGFEGFRKIEHENWDLVITDVIMPGMDGIELLERVHTIKPDLSVIVMTVDSTAQKIVSAIRENAFTWFQKPFTRQAVREMVDSALAAAAQPDDIQILSATPRWLELRLRCDLQIATRALRFFNEMEQSLPQAEREKVATSFREILFNAVEHGGGNDRNVYVTVTYTRGDGVLLFHVRDPGEGFSFSRLRHAAVSNPPDEPAAHVFNRLDLGMRPGGFGILLSRSLVDELHYNETGNEALLIKYLKPQPR